MPSQDLEIHVLDSLAWEPGHSRYAVWESDVSPTYRCRTVHPLLGRVGSRYVVKFGTQPEELAIIGEGELQGGRWFILAAESEWDAVTDPRARTAWEGAA